MRQWVTQSEIGVARKENQDRAKVLQKDQNLFALLCDGMGGHFGGQKAAQITVDVFEKEFFRKPPKKVLEIATWFQNTLRRVQTQMHKVVKHDAAFADMGTTLTGAFILNNTIMIFNVGDSRTYIYNDKLHQITSDHNLRNYYIHEQNLAIEKANRMLGGAALTSALGPNKKTKVDAFELSLTSQIKYLILTSDGIHEFLSKPDFELIIHTNSNLKAMAQALVKSALKGESSDNLTAVIVELQ